MIFESTLNKQQYGTKITCIEERVTGGGGGGGGGKWKRPNKWEEGFGFTEIGRF